MSTYIKNSNIENISFQFSYYDPALHHIVLLLLLYFSAYFIWRSIVIAFSLKEFLKKKEIFSIYIFLFQ